MMNQTINLYSDFIRKPLNCATQKFNEQSDLIKNIAMIAGSILLAAGAIYLSTALFTYLLDTALSSEPFIASAIMALGGSLNLYKL